MRWLAIDHGTRRTGVAICDDSETLAGPLCMISTDGALVEKIVKIITEENAGGVVLGLPLNMDDTEGPQAKIVREFAVALKKKTTAEVVFFDERLSTFEAEQKLIGLDLTRKKKKKHIDAIAAAAILQAFLDSRQK